MEDIQIEYEDYELDPDYGDWDNIVFESDDENEYDLDHDPSNKAVRRQTGSYIPSHLSMPIVNDDVDFLLQHDEFFCSRHKKLKKFMEDNKVQQGIYAVFRNDPYPVLKSYIENELLDDLDLVKKMYLKIIDISLDSAFVHKMNFFGKSTTEGLAIKTSSKFKEIKQKLREKTELFSDFCMMKKVERIKDRVCSNKIPYGETFDAGRGMRIERDLMFYELGSLHVVGPTNLLLCVLDIYQSRFSKRLLWSLKDIGHCYPKSMYERGNFLIGEFEYLRHHLGKSFFTFLSTWEPLVLGSVIADPVNDLGFSELFTTSKAAMEEVLVSARLKYDISNLLPDLSDKDDIKMNIELLGSIKHFGHPNLDLTDGFNNVREHGTEIVNVDTKVARMAVSIMKRDFVKNYIAKKNKWPNCRSLPKEFKLFYKEGKYPHNKSNEYTIWSEVEFGQVFEYDYSPDTTELIKDSSSSELFQDWYAPYDNCAFHHLYGKRKPKVRYNKPSTRVIERFLQGQEFDLKKKIYELNSDYFHQDDNIASLCRKEQELKEKGRLFTKQTYDQRLAQTSMENNISKQFMRYVPEQTMTVGEVQLMRRLADTAKDQKEQRIEILNLDLSKWNMKFRHELVYWFGKELDDLFGMEKLYRNNHFWFLDCHVFCNSRLAPPDYDYNMMPIQGEYYYHGHLGGMEGMRQKLWTVITICLIKLAAETERLNINIMCQGDNQVVMLKHKHTGKDEKAKIRNLFLERLSNVFQSVNLKLKREETWFSTRLCEFGKVRYFDGEAISNCDKKINRCISDINDGISSFMSSLSTINTITEATSKADHDADKAFIINQFLILNHLYRKKVITEKDNDTVIMSFLFHPTDFGGISLSTYFSHCLRGFDDKLTLWISLLSSLKKYFPHVYHQSRRLNRLEPKPGEVNHGKLVEDIFSLNIRNLPSVEKKMKNLALAYIQSPFVTNPEVTKIFKSSTSVTKEDLVKYLVTMKPFIPSIAHELLRNSNVGILLALRNQFSSVSTINKVVQELSPNYLKKFTKDLEDKDFPEANNEDIFDFISIAEKNNKKVISELKRRKLSQESFFGDRFVDMHCPTAASEELRRIHWGLDIMGASRPYPPCQFYIKPVDQCSEEEYSHSITMMLSSEYAEIKDPSYLRDGPYNSYLGSATKEKIKKPSLDIASKTSFTKAIQQLVLIRSWAQRTGSANLIGMIDFLIEEKKAVIPEDLMEYDTDDWCAQNWGGNILHRFRSLVEKDAAVINFLSTLGSHVQQSTNNLAGITSGGRDFTIHFQMILIYNIALLNLVKYEEHLGVSQFCSVLTCPDCTKEVTTVEFDTGPGNPFVSRITQSQILVRESCMMRELEYSPEELELAVSIHLGRVFGRSCDVSFSQYYINEKLNNVVKPTIELNSISINDLRYVNLRIFFSAMISSSKILKAMLFNYNPMKIFFQRSLIFAPLCTFLHNAKMVKKALIFLDIDLTEHYQAIDPIITSSVILGGIEKMIKEDPRRVAPYIISRVFKTDDSEFIKMNQRWFLAFVRKFRLLPRLPENYSQERADDSNYIIFSKTWEIKEIISLSRTMEEEKAILLLRRGIQSGIFSKAHIPDITCSAGKRTEKNLLTRSSFIEKLRSFNNRMSDTGRENLPLKNIQHLARPKGIISTAINKIAEIVLAFNLTRVHVMTIYCLAEGSGGIGEGLARIFPNSSLVYNSLMLPNVDKRMGVDQNYPPAVLASKVVDLTRLNPGLGLSRGETNIKKRGFVTKLKSAFLVKKPDIVTMDAEAAEGSDNEEIIMSHFDVLMEHKPSCFIYKTFMRGESFFNTDLLNKEFPLYKFYYFKPMSSHPNNEEIYLVALLLSERDKLLSEYEDKELSNMSQLCSDWVGLNKISTELELQDYMQLCRERNTYLNIEFPMLEDATNLFSCFEKKYSCTIFCRKLRRDLLDLISELHNFDNEDDLLYPIIRNGGIEGNITHAMCLYTAIEVLRYYKEDKFSVVSSIVTARLDFDLRTGLEAKEYYFIDSFKDNKNFLRGLFTVRTSKKCRCKRIPRSASWTDGISDPIFKNLSKMISVLTQSQYSIVHDFQ